MDFINTQILALRAVMRDHAITGAINSYNLVKTVSPRTPPPRRISELSVQQIRELDKAYRIAYVELRRIAYNRWKNQLEAAIKIQQSVQKQRKDSSTAPITKGS